MESNPKFHNASGIAIVYIGCREFKCIGDRPPHDHPHIYLNMGEADSILCPYCATVFRFDASLGHGNAEPADCAYRDSDFEAWDNVTGNESINQNKYKRSRTTNN